MILKISNNSKKKCRKAFPIVGIGGFIRRAVIYLETTEIAVVIAEYLSDPDVEPNGETFFNVMKFLICANCTDKNIISKINKLTYNTNGIHEKRIGA